MRTLYIGETNKEDTEYYYTLDESAFNLDIKNYKKGLQEKKSGIFYTSLVDFQNNYELLYEICLTFDSLIYNPPKEWREVELNNYADLCNYTSNYQRLTTESVVMAISTFRDIQGIENIFDLGTFYPVVNRQTDSPNLWIAGCSFSSAIGVDDKVRWGQLVAEQLSIPVNFLAEPGSGNSHQIHKILSSDIRKDDIVIMQATFPERNTIIYQEYQSGKFRPWNLTSSVYHNNPDINKIQPIGDLIQPTSYINQIRDFKTLQNICKKIGVKLIVWGADIIPNVLLSYLNKQDNYFHFTNTKHSSSTKFFLDYGSDNMHPGPLQHLAYSEFILEKLRLVKE